METIIKDVKIVNYDKIIKNADVILENNVIKQIIKKEGEAEQILIPGFIDTHIHGFAGDDVMDGTEAVERISKKLASYGITSFMPTAMTNEWSEFLQALNNISKAKKLVSKNIGIHIEGPFIGPAKKGAHKLEWLRKATLEDLKEILASSNYTLRKVSFDPTMLDNDLIKYLVANRIIASIGHSSANYAQSMEAYNAGASCTCHLWNAMSGVESRNPGMLQAALTYKKPYAEIIIDFMHVSKESVLFSLKNKNASKLICVSDAIRPAHGIDGDSQSGGIPVTKKGLLITLKGTNTIAGSGISIYDAFKNLISLGIGLSKIVQMTSYNAAKNSNLKNIAQIKKDYIADLILMDKEYNIKKVYIEGKEVKR
ncbi:N-acetylglucosamine-6-phosphate deacetylase [Mycoplasmopsis alligatoris]|uniref:N-acetylglucosamine-6-phosphate deacetylase n=1 Tax=Mycoplasmopsis alligatoris A21JP2 TaxID=747682 RepID=D4XX47_9BACT|nr:N-acetylglucosamine-6-phosphate deacetylase [Mycoplasmopsis alligatoris]EFF41079.1 N-acetylglucosamine-6-phosphate deacetylase [Mycoplasmopsis alligatoris A21JP2]